ncbi:MAG TPA: flavodoxin family protein [bacterium]|nr:flavodoxin family protein [bacterium]
MKVIAVNGSPRKRGNTYMSLSRVCSVLKEEGISSEIIQLSGKKAQGCTACYKCFSRADGRCHGRRDDLNSVIERMMAADGILLGSPVYFGSLTPELKALIDRAGLVTRANGHLLNRKVGAAVAAVRRQGALQTFNQINQFFLINNMIVPGSSYWNLAIGRQPGEVENDEEGMSTLDTLGKNMAWLMKKIDQ